jgi:hypothetical protein
VGLYAVVHANQYVKVVKDIIITYRKLYEVVFAT